MGVVQAADMPAVSHRSRYASRLKSFDAGFAWRRVNVCSRKWDDGVPVSKHPIVTATEEIESITRRSAMRLIGATTAGLLLPLNASHSRAASESSTMLSRAIPVSGEKLPVIGLGTWRTFDVEPSENERKPLEDVLRALVGAGARVVDSSPMYGRAEEVIGDLSAKLGIRESLFLATKVWTRGKEAGVQSMERSFSRLRTKTIDLMQVHNLVDVATQLATMREWKAQGRIRYIGVTHYTESALDELVAVLSREKVDFVQINYSIDERRADEKLLPLAQERGIAVIANRPFGGGDLFGRVRGKPLPDFAKEIDCQSWAQFFLKWIVAHPVITCAIPATNNLAHLQDNMRAGTGRLPDQKMRSRMVDYVSKV